jgi:predicted Zn-dependent peptidase
MTLGILYLLGVTMNYEPNVFFTKEGNHVVHVQTQKDSKIFRLELIFAAGSKYAPPGLAHFFEHCVFLGTTTKDRTDIEESLMRIGGDYNAWTNKDAIALCCSGLVESFEEGLRVLTDMAFNCTLDKDLDVERNVVLAEMAPEHNENEELIDTDGICSFLMYGKTGFSELGDSKSVNKYTSKHLKEFKSRYFTHNRCFVSVSCPLEEKEVAMIVDRVLNKRKGSRGFNQCLMIPKRGMFSKYVQVPGMGNYEVETQFALLRPSDTSKAFLEEFVASTLSCGELSPIFGPARKRGLVYRLRSSIFDDADCSVLSISFETKPEFKFVSQTIDLITETLSNISEIGVTEETLAMFKKCYLFETYEFSQNPTAILDEASSAYLKNRFILSTKECVDALNRLDLKSYKNILQKIVSSDSKTIAIVGPQSQTKSLTTEIRKIEKKLKNL